MSTFIWFLIVFSLALIGIIVYLLSGNWKKAFMVVGGWGVYEITSNIYDYIFWPFIQNRYGDGSVIFLSIGATIMCFLLLKWYQVSGNDWLGVNYLEEIKIKADKWANLIYKHQNWFIRIIMFVPAKSLQLVIWLLKINDISAFLFLSIWKDSFVTTAFLRHGKFGKLEKRDYRIFIVSAIISGFAWGAFVKFGIWIITIIGKVMCG